MKRISSLKQEQKGNSCRRTTIDLPQSLYERIAALADTEARSIDDQIILLLEQGLAHRDLAEERIAAFRYYTTQAFGGLTAEDMEAMTRGMNFAADME